MKKKSISKPKSTDKQVPLRTIDDRALLDAVQGGNFSVDDPHYYNLLQVQLWTE
jgi:hypothetical protein